MVEEYDPDSFSIRVSQRLFQTLSGRAAEPDPIEARTPREAGLIDATRKEGRRERAALHRQLREAEAKRARKAETVAAEAAAETAAAADRRLADLYAPSGPTPCAASRSAVIACLGSTKSDDGSVALECAAEVAAFSECAKQLAGMGA